MFGGKQNIKQAKRKGSGENGKREKQHGVYAVFHLFVAALIGLRYGMIYLKGFSGQTYKIYYEWHFLLLALSGGLLALDHTLRLRAKPAVSFVVHLVLFLMVVLPLLYHLQTQFFPEVKVLLPLIKWMVLSADYALPVAGYALFTAFIDIWRLFRKE